MAGPNPYGVMHAAREVNHLARDTRQEKMALALTAISVVMVAMMAIKEFREMFGRDPDPPRRRHRYP